MGRTRKLRRRAALAVGTATVLVAGCGVITSEADVETVVIAADLDLSGNGADEGAIYENALQLRVEQVNQQGLLGDKRRLELRVLDNGGDEAAAVQNIAEFVADPDVTAIVTGGCAQCALAAVETVNEAGVPTISLAANRGIVEPVEERRFVFQLAPTAADNVRELTSELARLNAETIALAGVDDGYSNEGRSQLREAAEGTGVEVGISETINGNDDRLDAVAASVVAFRPDIGNDDFLANQVVEPEDDEQVGPDAVVVWAPETLAGRFAVALDEAGYEGQLLFDSSAAGELFLNGQAGAALDGARMVFTETLVIDSVIASSPAKAARKNWFDDYVSQEGTYHAQSSFAADAVQVVVAAVNRFDSVDRDQVRNALENTQIDGLSGPIRIRVETHAGLKRQALVPLVAQGDRWRLATN